MSVTRQNSNEWTPTCVLLEAAPKSSSMCKICHKTICKAQLRFGTMYTHTDGYIYLEWRHMACSKAPRNFNLSASERKHFSESEISQIDAWMKPSAVPRVVLAAPPAEVVAARLSETEFRNSNSGLAITA